MPKTILLDAQAYALLQQKKQELIRQGIQRPTFSDAVRYACGKLDLKIEDDIDGTDKTA